MFFVNGEKKKVDDLIKEFNVPIPETSVGVMELHPSQVRPDYTNGGIKHTVAKRFGVVFRGTHPTTHEDLEIAYTKATPKKKTDGGLQFTPRKMSFEGHKKRFDMKTQKEEWVFYWLYPANPDSPFFNNKEAKWQVFSAEAIAERQLKVDDMLTDCLVEIKNTDFATLKTKAKGMNVSTYEKKEAEIRADLIAKAKADPKQFLQDWTSRSNEWKGAVKDAIDGGLFKVEVVNGVPRWYWGAGERKGNEICIITKGHDSFEFLLEKMMDELDFYRNQVSKFTKNIAVEEQLEEKLKSEAPEAETTEFRKKIEALNEKGYFKLQDGKVFFVKGEKEDALFIPANKEKWMDELEAKANNDASIKAKINANYRFLKD